MLPEIIIWNGTSLEILDQRKLPDSVQYINCATVEQLADAIETLAVRGAPAIGIAAAWGVVLASVKGEPVGPSIERLRRTRPTAVNLFWALDRMAKAADYESEAKKIQDEDIENNRKIGAHGQKFLPDECTIITHCNAGALATGGWGTALGIVRSAREAGKNIKIFACETRPLLQGARLTAWELDQDGFDVTLICDSMAAYLMKLQKIDAVIVGADRIAANGDAANKIGTYSLAVNANKHGVPFFVAAPKSTLDLSIPNGDAIPIEERKGDE
ncbi:MAG: S-methyl-5-thioribose-1-phosphate isomerase, partial [Synergistaceae bacterium]|nr:S-methyl-5-thioribose-1-phosphate isomerase [Synergistaceae bacterium]